MSCCHNLETIAFNQLERNGIISVLQYASSASREIGEKVI